MVMIFYEKDKVLSCDVPNMKVMNPEYYPKPSIGEKVVLDGIMYMVCNVTTNYDENQIIVIIDRV